MRKIVSVLCLTFVAGYCLVALSCAEEPKGAEEKAPAVVADKAEKAEAMAEKAEAMAEKAETKAEKAETKAEAPEFVKFEKTGKMPAVKFLHKKHAAKLGGCKDCHEGGKPLFAQKKSEAGLLMKDMYTGAACGKCHDGNAKEKHPFAAKTGCMKCHKKDDKK